jgi:heterodisulfide reductase subunit B
MKLSYYPGCTLTTKAFGYNDSALAAAKAMGIELQEIEDWTCCGAMFPQVTDNIMELVAAARNLIAARDQAPDQPLVTLCPFCYNTLKRTNRVLKNDEEKRTKLCDFIECEPYDGSIRVMHYIEVLRDVVGFDNLRGFLREDVSFFRAVPYYGCLLLRPEEEIGLDSAENPRILDNMLEALGFETLEFPHKTECCGSYLAVSSEQTVDRCVSRIAETASHCGAQALVVTCPLCFSNLEQGQIRTAAENQTFRRVPVFYFTQLLALALGLEASVCRFEDHQIDPMPLLESKPAAMEGVQS